MELDEVELIPKKPRRETAEPNSEISTFDAGKPSLVVRPPGSVVGPAKFEDGVVYRLYFKGLVSKETTVVAGFGAAICDQADNLLFQTKDTFSGDGVNRKGAEIRALIRGLSEAIRLGIKFVAIYCDYYPIYQFVSGRWAPEQKKIVVLLEDLQCLRQQLTFSKLVLVGQNDIKFAFKLAREALISHISPPMDSSPLKAAQKESCLICLDGAGAEPVFSVDKCLHHYCFKCVKQHIEMKLLQGMEPKCPHAGCRSELTIDSCGKLLTPKLIEMWKQRIKEVPVTEEDCCLYPGCSSVLSKTELSGSADPDQPGVRSWVECRGLFCKVPWHSQLSCNTYKKLHPDNPAVDVKLKSLADIHRWRLCFKCHHMVEISQGCYHMTCRCGYEFCYKCRAEWKKNQHACPSSWPLFEDCDNGGEDEEGEDNDDDDDDDDDDGEEEEEEDDDDDEEEGDEEDYFEDPFGDRWSSFEEYIEYCAQMSHWYGVGEDEVPEAQRSRGTLYIMDEDFDNGYDNISWDCICQCGGLSDSDDDKPGVYFDPDTW